MTLLCVHMPASPSIRQAALLMICGQVHLIGCKIEVVGVRLARRYRLAWQLPQQLFRAFGQREVHPGVKHRTS